MLKKLIYALYFIVSLSCFSQDFSLKGRVIDENNVPIAYANVVINTSEDDLFIKGTTTNEDGVFQIKGLKSNKYNLKISFLGYEVGTISVDLKNDTTLEDFILKEKTETLDGITIVAKRPTVKRMVDRLIFNVENSTLSNNNVLDILKHTPGVIVNNGVITVKQSTPTVYINDRKVHLSSSEIQQLLEGTSASNIKSIEVITNPPAKYEAEGGAVLNIVTSKNIVAGYNGSINGNFKQGSEFPKYSIGTSHFFKTKRLNTYFNYNISPKKNFRHNNESINFIENTINTSSWETDLKRTHESANQNFNTNIDYQINENNSIGFSSSILISPKTMTKTSINSLTEVFNINKDLDYTFNTRNSIITDRINLAFTLDYIHKFKKEGEKLSLSTHYTNYDYFSDQNVKTRYELPDNSLLRNTRFKTLSGQKIELYTAQLDYELPISDSAEFETGAKISSIDSKSDLTQFNFVNNEPIKDIQNSDVFLYDELNYAAYASYSKQWDSWSLKSGLRVEYTDIKGNSLSTNQVNNSDYIKFFPSLHILNKLNDKNEIYFNYNKRIHRPRYTQLNPFKYFLSDNAYSVGDPNLKPQIDDVFTLGYTYKDTYTFEAYYRFEKDPVLEIVFQDNEDNTLKYINTNINRSISYGLDFTTYVKIANRWNVNILSSLFYYENEFFALESNNVLETINKWSVYAQVINYFTFLNDNSLTADVSYLFISSLANGPSIVSNRSGLGINFRKKFWNNRASLSVGVTDVFNNQNFTQTTKYLNQNVFLKSRLENRLITLGFKYKFGNFRLSNNQKNIELDERERLN